MIISIDLPETVGNSFCKQLDYQPTLLDIDGNTYPNPQTPLDFITQKLLDFILSNAQEFEINKELGDYRQSLDTIRKAKLVELKHTWTINGSKIVEQIDTPKPSDEHK